MKDKIAEDGHSSSQELRRGLTRILCAALGVGLGISGLLTYSAGLFAGPLAQEIQLSRPAYGAIFFGATVAMCCAMPLVGRLIEARGARTTALIGAIALALGFAALSRINSVLGYALTMVLTGFFAAASTPAAHTRVIASSFSRHRGFALGLTQLGIGIAAAAIPPIVTYFIVNSGWRSGFLALAGMGLLGALPALGIPAHYKAKSADTPKGNDICTVGADRVFLVQISAFFLMALSFAGMLSHFVPMLGDSGIPLQRAAQLASLIGISVIGTRILIGWLSDRMDPTILAAASCLCCAAGCAALGFEGPAMAEIGALALGAAMGAEADLLSILTARHFPIARYSRAYAIQYAAFTLAAGVSPLWIGFLADRSGYQLPLFVCAALLSVPAALFIWLGRIKKGAQRS